MPYALPSYLIQKMLHSKITPGEQRWHPHHQITIAFCFPQLISHSFLGLSAGKFEKKQRCTKQEKKTTTCLFLAELVSDEGVSGLERLSFNLVLSADCVTESRVRIVVSYFWGIFDAEQVNILPKPQLLNILTSHKAVFKLSLPPKQNWRNTRRTTWGGGRFLTLVWGQQHKSVCDEPEWHRTGMRAEISLPEQIVSGCFKFLQLLQAKHSCH